MSIITGTDNAEALSGTDGDDTIFGLAGNDSIEGAGGFDTVAYWTSPFGVVVRLFAGITDNDGFGGQDVLSNVEGVAGTAFADLIYGNDLGNYIQGFNGNDTIFALGGDDIIRAGEGDDFVDGGEGTDRLFFVGARAEYTVSPVAGGFRIVDSVPGRYGDNTVLNIELFQFADTQVTAAEILDPNAPGDGQAYPPTQPAAPTGFELPVLVLGNFGASPAAGGWSSADRYPRQMADVNGDGRADIVGFGEAGVLVALADGSGGFGPAELALANFGAGAGAGGWASDARYPRQMADVNGDGRADIVGFGEAGVLVALADGSGGFGAVELEVQNFGAGAGAGGWAANDRYPRHVADVNGDGRADIVGFGEGGVWVSLADGSGGFGQVELRLESFGAGAAAGGWSSDDRYPRRLADVNGDGRADVVGFGEGGVWVALADGSGGFGQMELRLADFGASGAAGGWTSDDRHPRLLADVNGDGRADVVGFGIAGVLVALGDASGGFGPVALRVADFGTVAGGWSSNDMYPRHVADVNGDGRGDVVGFGEAGVLVALSGDIWS